MELNQEQIDKFIELNKDLAGFENFTKDQVREIANGVANYYLTLFNINKRIKTDEQIYEKGIKEER